MCSENQVGINSVKTKDYAYHSLETTLEVFWWVKKKGFFVWVFVNFQELFRFLNKLWNSSNTTCIQSQVKCLFYKHGQSMSCAELPKAVLYFLFARHHNHFVSKKQAVMSSFICWRAACSQNLFTYWEFYDELFYHYLTRLGSYLLLENEGEKGKAGLWKW